MSETFTSPATPVDHHLFTAVFEQSPMALAIFRGPELIIERGNALVFEMWGKSPSITGLPLIEGIPELAGQPFIDLIREVYETGVPFFGNGVKAFLQRRGKMEEAYFDFAYTPLRDSRGMITGVMAMATEVTEKILAQLATRNSELQLESIIATAPAAMAIYVGRDLAIQRPNQAFIDVLGKGPDIIGKPLKTVMPEMANQPYLEILDKVYTTGIPFKDEMSRVLIMREGELKEHYYNVTYNPLRNAHGEIYGILGMGIDVTAAARSQHWLEDQVSSRTASLASSNELLSRSNEQLQQFAHVTSHDLREPVRKIRLYLERLVNDPESTLSEAARTYAGRISVSAQRMDAMISGVLQLALLEKQDELFEPVALSKVVRNVLEELHEMIIAKNVKVTVGALPVVPGIELLLYQLFYNLFVNSFKFSRPDVPPVLEIQESHGDHDADTMAVITIRDNGIGFDPVYDESIFQTFYRLHPKDRYEGTGLGLALCRRIAARHGGTLTATGSPNEGAIFTIKLPLKHQS